MAAITRYYPGGYKPAAPQKNRADEYDNAAGTFTAWDPNGNVTASRPLTAAEIAELSALDAETTAEGNDATLRARAQQALTANATFLAIGAPTNAQTLAQVQRLTKECNALIRLLLGLTADIADTA